MIQQIKKFEDKLLERHLAEDRAMIAVCGFDDTVMRNGRFGGKALELIFGAINILGLLYFMPHPLYRGIIQHVAKSVSILAPEDSETRTLLHDIPVIEDFTPECIINALARCKGAVFRNGAVIAQSTVSIEQAFISASSVIHALFIKYFVDYWRKIRSNRVPPSDRQHFEHVLANLFVPPESNVSLGCGPFDSEPVILREMVRAGKATVNAGLVGPFFGNVSYTTKETCYISQTGSSLDELEGAIVSLPINGPPRAGLNASSELSTHIHIVKKIGCRSILHGHPKFSVIASMMCEEDGRCHYDCYRNCPKLRDLGGIPIVAGEIGAGGLAKTLPPRIEADGGAIAYGHGVFTTGVNDFRKPFDKMVEIERTAREFTLTQCGML
jgi:ribulose-5-phosphate 4-epimerase/fuculose-1-phosphate aldolase